MTDEASTKHPHEPEIPPALDNEGRCLVCGLIVERDELKQRADALAGGVRSFLDSLPFQPPEAIGFQADVKLRQPLSTYDNHD